MTTRQWILLLIGVCAIAALVGCGGGSSSTPPPPPVISVSFSTAPPSSLQVSKTAPVTAAVANDSSNAGVDWSCTPASACGSFSPTHTASGSATTYTAPASVPTGNTVTIKATSTADSTKSASGNTTITVLPIVISFSQAPPQSMNTLAMAPIAATVNNDPQNLGVDWTVTCGSSDCGSFNINHTKSGDAVSYTAPGSIPSGGTVTVKAASTADPSKFVSAKITITQGAIVIFFQPHPPPSLLVSSITPLTAVVQNDPSGAGVDWSCTPLGSCGSFVPTHTASNNSTNYHAPASVTTVTVTATSTADNTKSVSAQIDIATIIVAFDPAPTPFMIVNATSPLTAVVSGDTTNAGVDWSCSAAGGGACGSFNPAHTASRQATNYTAPGSAATVTVTATSTADNTRLVQSVITVATSFNNAALNGSYVFAASGRDTFAHVPPGAYQVTGVLIADGSGNITGGEQLYSDQPSAGVDPICATGSGTCQSKYSIGADGRGTIVLDTGDASIGVAGVETFRVVLLGGTQGMVTQFDASASSSGTLDLQTPSSANTPLANGYAFTTNGVEVGVMRTPSPLGIGGVFNVDGAGTISGVGSVVDINDNGTLTTGASLSGTVANPDQYGKSVLNLTLNSATSVTFLGFTVDDTHVKMIERDHTFGATGGTAYAQGSSTGTFTNASFNTTVVYSTLGYSTDSTGTLQPTAYAGVFDADGVGDIGLNVGYTDENQFGTQISDPLTGNYAADSSGTGRVVTTNMFYGNGGGQGPSWIFYLTGASDAPALILQVDGSTTQNPNFIETVGTAYTQTGSSFNSSPYGMGFAYFPLFSQSGGKTGIGEDDGTGRVQADGVSNLSSGMEDLNFCDPTNFNFTTGLCQSFTPVPGLNLSGSFATSSVPGRLIGTLSDTSGVFNFDPIVFYVADGTRVLFIDMGGQPALGVFRQQE